MFIPLFSPPSLFLSLLPPYPILCLPPVVCVCWYPIPNPRLRWTASANAEDQGEAWDCIREVSGLYVPFFSSHFHLFLALPSSVFSICLSNALTLKTQAPNVLVFTMSLKLFWRFVFRERCCLCFNVRMNYHLIISLIPQTPYGMIHPKKSKASFFHPRVIQKRLESSVEHKEKRICVHSLGVNVAWLPASFKVSYVFCRRKKNVQVWNDMSVSKWR